MRGSLLLARRFLGRRRGLGFSVVGGDVGLDLGVRATHKQRCTQRDERVGQCKVTAHDDMLNERETIECECFEVDRTS